MILTATEEPTKLDLDGTDVDDIASNVRFAAGSVLIAPSSNYIALEDGVFTLKSSGGGGGGGGGGATTVDVTIANFSGNDMPAGTLIYAESIEDLMNGVYNEVEAIANGATKDIVMSPGWVIAFMVEIDPSIVNGNNITLNDAGSGRYYWTIGDEEDYANFTITNTN